MFAGLQYHFRCSHCGCGGDLERHLGRARKIYRERRDAFLDCLREELGPESEDGFRFHPPEGGLACWVELPRGLDAEAWCSACQRASLKVHPGRRYEFSGQALPGLRLGFAHLEPEEARDALGILKRALPHA